MENITEKLIIIGFWAAWLLILIAIIRIIVDFVNWWKLINDFNSAFFQDQLNTVMAKSLVKNIGTIILGIVLLWIFW